MRGTTRHHDRHRRHVRQRTRRRPGRSLAVAVVAVSACTAALVPSGAVSAACWLPPVDAPVSDPYRAPACPWCPGNRGIEYATLPGGPVRAVAAGRVTFAGTVVDRRYVVVEHVDGRRATYGHLGSVAVDVGDAVVARSVVGTTGSTFHFGLRDEHGYLDPTPELGRASYPVRLVPLDGSAGVPPGPPRPRCATTEKPGIPVANPFWRR